MRGKLEEIRDVTKGLWFWRVRHPGWKPDSDWQPVVTCTCVESGGEVALVDPIAPPDEAPAFWERMDAKPPTYLLVLLPDHVRGVDFFAHRLGIPAYGPYFFWKDDVPETDLEHVDPGTRLPGDLLALYDGRGRKETPVWLPEQRALLFGDTFTERDGELRVWGGGIPWYEERVLPALRSMLEFPFEHVIISHGEPLHDRAAFERALDLPPWSDAAG